MSKSLEALEELCSRCCVESECYTSCEYKELLEKDLERLEELEKENQTLNEALDFAKVDYTTARINLDNASVRIKDLEKENQELKSKYNDLMLDFKMFDFNTLKQENEKLKKAIEIIKSKNVDIFFLVNNCEFVLDNYNYEIEDDIMKYCYKDCSTLTQQECDLLKEVLE